MKPLRISTFNVENLFRRYVFLDDPAALYEKQILPSGIASFDVAGGAKDPALTVLQRNNTARAILDSKPDVLAMQEVEDLWAVRLFNDQYLDGYFDRMITAPSNDSRNITMALCVRRGYPAEITGFRTHVDEMTVDAIEKKRHIDWFFNAGNGCLQTNNAIFSRDAFEVDLTAGELHLTFIINHFKSQSDGSDKIRLAQAARVAELVKKVKDGGRRVVVLGDLNADWDKPTGAGKSLQPLHALVEKKELIDPFADKDEDERWTHYYTVQHDVSRLDYILVDGALRSSIRDKMILRKGLTLKCTKYEGERYPTIGYNETEASDHCPLTIELDAKAPKAK